MINAYLPAARVTTVQTAVDGLAERRPVILFGATGVGKTYIAATVMLRLVAQDLVAARLRPTAAGDGLLFGLVRVGAADDYGSQSLGPETIEGVANSIAGPRGPRVIHVDDAHLFDERHLKWLASLVDRRAVSVLIGITSEEGIGTRAAAEFAAQWMEHDALRIDLAAFDGQETDRMVDSLTGGVPIDIATRLAVQRGTGGVPVLIRELVHELLESGPATGLTSTFTYPLPPTPSKRIGDVVRHLVRALGDDERDALVLLARLDGIPYERAARYLGEDAVRRLLNAGFITRDDNGAVEQVHRIEAQTVLAVRGEAQLRPLSREIAQVMRDDLRSGSRLTPLEYVLLAETMLDDQRADGPPAGSRATEEAEIFLAASEKSISIGSIHTALSFARASSRARPGVAALVTESRCLCAMGNLVGALDAVTRAEGLPASPFEGGLVERWRIHLDAWFTPSAAAPLDHAVRGGGAGLREATSSLLASEWDRALETARDVIEQPSDDPLTRLRALGILLVALARKGDAAGVRHAIATGDDLVGRLTYRDAYEQTVVEDERDAFFALRALAQLVAGIGLDSLGGELEAWMCAALARHDFTRIALFGALAGLLELSRGDVDTSETELRLAAGRMTVVLDEQWLVWIPGLHAHALRRAGRADDAERVLLRVLSAYPSDSPLHRYAVGWIRTEVAGGSLSSSLDEWADGAGGSATASPVVELATMMQAVEQGEDASTLLARASSLRSDTDLPLLHGMADFVIGVARHDGLLLENAARQLASAHYFEFASIAASASARMRSAAGLRAAAAASEGMAKDYRARGVRRGVAAEPALIDLSTLTVREREIVTLVAAGRSNREVAQTLFLSVRTVESHFYQARIKLGAMSRSELTRLVRLAQGGPAS